MELSLLQYTSERVAHVWRNSSRTVTAIVLKLALPFTSGKKIQLFSRRTQTSKSINPGDKNSTDCSNNTIMLEVESS